MRVLWEIVGVGEADPMRPTQPPVTYVRDGQDWPPLLRMPMCGELITIEHVVTSDRSPYRRNVKETFRVVREGFWFDLADPGGAMTCWKVTLEKAD